MAFSDDFEALKRTLSDAGVAHEDFLREAGITRFTWSRWENRKFSPRRSTWDAVTAAAERLTGQSQAA